MSCYKRKLPHVGHKWVICGSHMDCSVAQWVKWINRCDPLSTLVQCIQIQLMNCRLSYFILRQLINLKLTVQYYSQLYTNDICYLIITKSQQYCHWEFPAIFTVAIGRNFLQQSCMAVSYRIARATPDHTLKISQEFPATGSSYRAKLKILQKIISALQLRSSSSYPVGS